MSTPVPPGEYCSVGCGEPIHPYSFSSCNDCFTANNVNDFTCVTTCGGPICSPGTFCRFEMGLYVCGCCCDI